MYFILHFMLHVMLHVMLIAIFMICGDNIDPFLVILISILGQYNQNGDTFPFLELVGCPGQ